jgi:transposase InsO family protein
MKKNISFIIMDTYLTDTEKKTILTKYAADPRTMGGRDRLHGHVRQDFPSITRRDVAAFLANDATHQIMRPINKRIISRPVIVSDRAKVYQIDLIDFKGLTFANDQRRYALTAVDVLSKYCSARSITRKTAQNVNAALMDILDSIPASWRPKVISCDRGSEFQTLMKKSLAERGIKLIHSQAYAPQSHGIVERFNRSLKSALFSLMTRHKTSRWIDFLEPLIENLNNTKHESTGHTPLELMKRPVLQKDVITSIHERMARRRPKVLPAQHREYKVGDIVRVALTTESAIRKQVFRKRIKNNWSSNLYEVYSVSVPEALGALPSYLLKNLDTNRKSKKQYFAYQLTPSSVDAAEQEEPVLEQEEEEEPEQPAARAQAEPVAIRRTARAWAPSAQALANLAR